MNLHKKIASLFLLAGILTSTSCTTNPYTGEQETSKAAIYGAAGLGAGALAGYLTGKDTKSTLIGAAGGAAAGGGYGYYTDVQEKKLREVLKGSGVQVKKEGKNIRLIMPGNITFDSGQYDLKSSFLKTLKSVSIVLKEYKKTKIAIGGHTDSSGKEAANITLSANRANSIAEYLISDGVDGGRISTNGYGSSSPIAPNTTAEGKAQNRRVEINLLPL